MKFIPLMILINFCSVMIAMLLTLFISTSYVEHKIDQKIELIFEVSDVINSTVNNVADKSSKTKQNVIDIIKKFKDNKMSLKVEDK